MAAPARIQPKQASLAATGIACLVGVMACILIGSIYVGMTSGWLQFALSVFSAATVCAVGASALAYAAHQQYMVKKDLFSDHDSCGVGQFDFRTIAMTDVGKEYEVQISNSADNNCRSRGGNVGKDEDDVSVADGSSSSVLHHNV